MAQTTTPACPRCDHDQTTYTGSRTERWGRIIDIESFRCDRCGHTFEQEA